MRNRTSAKGHRGGNQSNCYGLVPPLARRLASRLVLANEVTVIKPKARTNKRGETKARSLKNPGEATACAPFARLLCRDQRMRDGVHGERNAVLDADFPHQLSDVRFDGAFFNA